MNGESDASREMPKYKCHKVVHALKIAKITALAKIDHPQPMAAVISPAEEGYAEFTVDENYMEKHKPEAGGYYVVYEDGYTSFSPADVFEAGYTLIEEFKLELDSDTAKYTAESPRPQPIYALTEMDELIVMAKSRLHRMSADVAGRGSRLPSDVLAVDRAIRALGDLLEQKTRILRMGFGENGIPHKQLKAPKS